MKLRSILHRAALGGGLVLVVLLVGSWYPGGGFISDAEARIGRPMTPASVAGVARRTTRRTIRRTSIYAATLPRGCTTMVIEGTTLHQCGGAYYQPYGSQYVVVNVD